MAFEGFNRGGLAAILPRFCLSKVSFSRRKSFYDLRFDWYNNCELSDGH